jgi:hypothetical protein
MPCGPESGGDVILPDGLLTLLRQPSLCFLTTLMPDGSPQNTVQSHQKVKNIERDRRVAVAVADSADPRRYYAVRGQVVGVTTEGGAEHIEVLAQRYLGGPYPWYGGREQVRVILTISADKIHTMGS